MEVELLLGIDPLEFPGREATAGSGIRFEGEGEINLGGKAAIN